MISSPLAVDAALAVVAAVVDVDDDDMEVAVAARDRGKECRSILQLNFLATRNF